MGQAPAAGPTARGEEGAEVCPLREVRLAEDDRAGRAQVGGDRRVVKGRLAHKRERSGRGLHLVPGVDVVFEQHRDPVERADDLALRAAVVRVLRELKGIGVQLDDTVDVRAGLVERADAVEVELGELDRSEPARGHLRLQPRDGELVVRGGRRACRARAERRGAGRDDGRDQQDDREDREHVPRHVG